MNTLKVLAKVQQERCEAEQRIRELEAENKALRTELARWSGTAHAVAFKSDAASKPVPCEMCGDAPC